jgi:hypothetical protein
MAIIFSKNSGLNDGLWKDIDRVVQSIMNDMDGEKTRDDEIVRALYNVKKSKKYAEKVTGLTTLDSFDIVYEGDPAPLDGMQETFPKLIIHNQLMKKFIITAEAKEDMNIDAVRIQARAFVKSQKRSRAQFAAAALVSEGAAFTYRGETLDRTTGDGKALFAVDHPGKLAGVAAQSNVFTNDFGADSVTLYRLANVGRNYRSDSGQLQGYTFDTIVLPGNVPQLEDLVKRIIRSDLMVGSANNDVNTQKGLWNLLVLPYWQAEPGCAPYILLSGDANEELNGSVFYDRSALNVENRINIDTHNLEYSGRFRMGVGFANWRHAIMGGASAGTTLT